MKTLSVAVRSMRDEDAEAVAALSGQLDYPASGADVRRRFESIAERGEAEVFVAEDATGRIVGWVHAYIVDLIEVDRHVEIGGLVVDEQTRGQGVGRALMMAAEAWTRQTRCGSVRVRSQIKREGAHAFYEGLGYEYVKTQKTFQKRLHARV
jgi:GNAT superfamily N-acetyltransferase